MSTSQDKILDMVAAGTISVDEAERLLKASTTTTPAVRTTSSSKSKSTTTTKSRSATAATNAKANDAFRQVMALGAPYGTGKRIGRFASRLVHEGKSVDEALDMAEQVIELVKDHDDPTSALRDAFESVVNDPANA